MATVWGASERTRGDRKHPTVLLAAIAALVTAAAAAGLGTLAAGYSSQQSASGLSVTTGSVTIGAGAANRLTTAVANLEPGDTIFRAIDLNSTTTLLSSVTLSTTDTYSGSKLSTNTIGQDGLQMTVQWCSTTAGWTELTSAPAYTYTCPGTTTTLIAARDVLTGTPISLGSGLNAENSAATLPTTDHLLITLTLPTSSPSAAQSAQSIINYTFTGVQLTPPKKAR
jgi:spore coat-associated protein N